MQKTFFLYWPEKRSDYPMFRRRILKEITPQFQQIEHARRLKVTLTGSAPPLLSLVPFQRKKLALFSLWSDTATDPAPYLEILAGAGNKTAAYRVTETTPVAYTRTWPLGSVSPGVGMLTLLNGNPKLSREAFMAEWFGRHTPMSIEIHPLWNYIRNVVETPLNADAPHFDGIVEEHFRSRSDLLNPLCLFGGPLHAFFNMVRVGLHINKFMDLKTMQNYLVEEVHITDDR